METEMPSRWRTFCHPPHRIQSVNDNISVSVVLYMYTINFVVQSIDSDMLPFLCQARALYHYIDLTLLQLF